MNSELKSFYDREYTCKTYSAAYRPEEHSSYNDLRRFITSYNLANKRCLEIGAGRGAFQDLVSEYTATDISNSVRHYFHKPFVQTPATLLPFPANCFDAIWSIATLEHIPDPEKALSEMRRVLRNGGLIYLAPAWQCRKWAAKGYPVRPYADFDFRDKVIKASIPVRNSIVYRSLFVLLRRVLHIAAYLYMRHPIRFLYRKLTPNYERFWMSDSDAVNSMDPFDAIMWFCSRGDDCLSHSSFIARFFVRTGPLTIRVRKTSPSEES